jgi:hypothetical protein
MDDNQQLPSAGILRTPLVDQGGIATPQFQRALAYIFKKLQGLPTPGNASADDALSFSTLFPQQAPASDNDEILGWLALAAANGVPEAKEVLSGTHAQRILTEPTAYRDALFVETDRNNLIYQSQSGAWVYVAGAYKRTQAQLAALAATLGVNDTGLKVEVTDYRHVLAWTGTQWKWGPGEDGRHDIVGLPVDPDDTTGWQLCDGTTVAYLKGDGTTANFATPDLVSSAGAAAYLKLGTPVSGPNAAVAPTFSGGAIANSFTGITVTGNDSDLGVLITSSGATRVALNPHTHPIADPSHTHSLTGGAIGSNGEPRNEVLRPWFRR